MPSCPCTVVLRYYVVCNAIVIHMMVKVRKDKFTLHVNTVHTRTCNNKYTLETYLSACVVEVSTGPKFPTRPGPQNFFSARPGPQSMYYKICTCNLFEILHQNQYNYIKLHSHFPLVQILYCSSTTVMYNVQLYQ